MKEVNSVDVAYNSLYNRMWQGLVELVPLLMGTRRLYGTILGKDCEDS